MKTKHSGIVQKVLPDWMWNAKLFMYESTYNWTQPPRVGRMRLSDYLDTEKQIT